MEKGTAIAAETMAVMQRMALIRARRERVVLSAGRSSSRLWLVKNRGHGVKGLLQNHPHPEELKAEYVIHEGGFGIDKGFLGTHREGIRTDSDPRSSCSVPLGSKSTLATEGQGWSRYQRKDLTRAMKFDIEQFDIEPIKGEMRITNHAQKIFREGSFLIAQIFQISGRVFARRMKEAGLEDISPEQGRVLFALWKKDGIPIQELTHMTSLRKSTLTVALDRLEKAGHVVREPSTRDRRQILIHLTEKDKQLQDAYAQLSDEMAELSYKGFSEKEIDTFEQALRRILANLKEHEQ